MLSPEIRANWTPADAYALIEACGGSVEAAQVRLHTTLDIELTRLARLAQTARSAHPWRRRRIDSIERDTRCAIAREWARRSVLLSDVARAHGLIGGDSCR